MKRRLGQVLSGQVGSGQVGSGRVGSGQTFWRQSWVGSGKRSAGLVRIQK